MRQKESFTITPQNPFQPKRLKAHHGFPRKRDDNVFASSATRKAVPKNCEERWGLPSETFGCFPAVYVC